MFKLFQKAPKSTASAAVKKAIMQKPAKKAVQKKAEPKKTVQKVQHPKKEVQKSEPKKVIVGINKMPDEKAFELLKKYKIQVPDYAFCKNEDSLKEALKRIGFPCAMKVSGSIVHKTNVSGVKLNISSEENAINAFRELIKIKGASTVLVQKMVTEGFELIIGGKKDPQFERVVALGAGGILTEVMKDVSFRIAPLSRQDAEEMLREVKFSEMILKGFRGQKPANANAIIEVILAVSRMLESNHDIKELDINPLFATSTGSIAADVRIILE